MHSLRSMQPEQQIYEYQCLACGSDRDGCLWCSHEIEYVDDIVQLKPTLGERIEQALFNFLSRRIGTICLAVFLIAISTITLSEP